MEDKKLKNKPKTINVIYLQERVYRYKVSMVDIDADTQRNERQVCDIGLFKDEQAVIQWMKENNGELQKADK